MIMKLLLILIACVISQDVFAGIFNVIPTDKSKHYLSIIFGSSVGSINLGNGNFNQTLSLMFEQFNFIIVTFGSIILGYTVVMSTINTAREGEALGKKMSAWIIMRSITGMLCMVPSPTSGYSVVQMTVMWVVLNGIGAANSVWNVILQQLSQNVNVSTGIKIELIPEKFVTIAQSIILSKTCLYSINNTLSPFLTANSNSPFAQYGPVQIYSDQRPLERTPATGTPTKISRTTNVSVGLQGAPAPFDRICGSFTVTTELNSSDSINTFNVATLNQRLTTKTNALLAMFDAVDPAAQLLASGIPDTASNYNPPDPGYVDAAGAAYISQISQLATGLTLSAGASPEDWETTQPQSINRITGNFATLKGYGWIHAGSYYYTMVQASRPITDPETQTSTANLPNPLNVPTRIERLDPTHVPSGWTTISGGENQGLSGLLSGAPPQLITQFNTSLTNALQYWMNDSKPATPPSQGITIQSTSSGSPWLDSVLRRFNSVVQRPLLDFFQSIANGGSDNTDPLLSLGKFGNKLMLAAEMSVLISLVVSAAISLAVSAGSCLNPLAWSANFMLTQFFPLLYGSAVLLWTSGAILGIYLPLVPYVIFTTTAFGWIIAVVEAIVGAPLLALGLVHPSGEELGKAGSALVILANVFLRPTLMIFGLVLGGGLLRAGIALINFGFQPAVAGSTMPSLFSFITVLMMYIFLIMALVNKSFSLIYMLPNQIMRWMGGPTESFDPSDMAKEAKSGFDAGASKVQAASQETVKHSQNTLDDAAKGEDARAASGSQGKYGRTYKVSDNQGSSKSSDNKGSSPPPKK